MLQTIEDVLITIGIGLLYSIPSILLGFWLEKKQIAPNRYLLSIIMCVILCLALRFFDSADLLTVWVALLFITGSTVGIYRMDIYWAIKRKSEKH